MPAGFRPMSTQLRLTDSNLPDYLRKLGFCGPDETLAVEKAGDGNINWVRRARVAGDDRSWVVKQARPALERFPEYQVTTERIVFEARYYARTRPWDREGICPEILHFDESERVLVLEDLGEAERLDARLAKAGDASAVAAALARFLAAVHEATGEPELAADFENDAMRRLHGDHIFSLPYEAGAFPLDSEVARRAARVQTPEFRHLAAAAYERYLEPRGALVHGDVQAGNVLLPPTGPKLLDAEIAHVGDPAFDVGSLVAHLLLPALARGEPGEGLASARAAWEAYSGGSGPTLRFEEVARYAGFELLRRTLGAARLPAVETADAALRVLDAGERWTREPPGDPDGLARS